MMMYHGAGGRPGFDWETAIKTLLDSSQRDDLKLKALQEVWAGFDVFCNSSIYSQILESLVKAFLKLFTETAPQFILENNTQQLRKLMLEIILRTTSNDMAKKYTKEIQSQMIKLIQCENEENGCLALKILIDHIKANRLQLTMEMTHIAAVLTHFRTVFREMHIHVQSGKMFEPRKNHRPTAPMAEDRLIETYLQNCYYVQKVVLEPGSGSISPDEPAYMLIPRASQSVKMLAEVPMLFVLMHNMYKSNITSELNEISKTLVSFINLVIPPGPRDQNSFNKELADEFYNCQMKSLSFLAFIAKQNQDYVFQNGNQIVSGILNLLEICPAEMVQARRELLIAIKFFYTSEIRNKFVQYVPRLFSESLMVGTGYTCQDNVRPVMYSMNADLLHHLRLQLPYPVLCHAVFVYSRCMHDVQLPSNIQSMSIRLMMNLCEAFNALETKQQDPCRDFLIQALETMVMKLKFLSHYHLPLLFKQYGGGMEWTPVGVKTCKSSDVNDPDLDSKKTEGLEIDCESGEQSATRRCSIDSVPELEIPADSSELLNARRAPSLPSPTRRLKRTSSVEATLSAVWAIPAPPLPLVDTRNMIKFILQSSKYVVQTLVSSKRTNKSISYGEEREIFVRFLKYGLQCLDVFMLPMQSHGGRTVAGGVRSRDEKDALDFFSSVFQQLNTDVFMEIFTKHMGFLIDRISHNYALQLICNSFLVNPDTSAKFGGILVNYLLKRMPEMSVNSERAALYLKLFKLMFSAVSCASSTGCADIEKMLRPYMNDLVGDAVKLAMRGREPQNYFLLLRALFRSIGGGAHDILYGQFLPLLPALLQQLNRLQSCAHRQVMRELFVELCLTVPVRLSSLLPYLPLLMEPLVSALNGTNTLVQQGLRTLELCVDNLQPEYLYQHMTPVRAGLLQGLWKTVGNPDPNSSATAFRILGKFGGNNRKMLAEPQKLKVQENWQLETVFVLVEMERGGDKDKMELFADTFPEEMQPLFAHLSITEAMKVAVEQLRQTSMSDTSLYQMSPHTYLSNSTNAPQIRQYSAEIARSVLLFGLSPLAIEEWSPKFMEDVRDQLKKLLDLSPTNPVYKCPKEGARQTYINALTALFFAIVGKDLRKQYVKFFNAFVKQLTLQSMLEQTGFVHLSHDLAPLCMDSSVLVDALVIALSDLNKEFVNAAIVALRHIRDTCQMVVEDERLLVRLPFLNYLIERVCNLCYGSSWYSRLGGASGIQYIIKNYPSSLVKANVDTIIGSLLEISIGLADEVSSGALDMASNALDMLPKICLPSYDSSNVEEHRILLVFIDHYTRHICTPDSAVREQIFALISTLSSHLGLPIAILLNEKRDSLNTVLTNAIRRFGGESMHVQCAYMNAFSLLIGGEKLMADVDENDPYMINFIHNVVKIVDTPLSVLVEDPLYRPLGPPAHHPHNPIQRMVPLKQAASECLIAAFVWLQRKALQNAEKRMENKRNDEVRKLQENDEFKEEQMDVSSTSESVKIISPNELLQRALVLLSDKEEKVQMTTRKSLIKAISLVHFPAEIVAEAVEKAIGDVERKITSISIKQLLHLAIMDNNLLDQRCVRMIMNQLIRWDADCPYTQLGSAPTSMPKERTIEDLHVLDIVMQLLGECPLFGPDCVTLVCSLTAKFDYEYCVDRSLNWETTILVFLNKYPIQTLHFFIAKDSVANAGRRSLIRRLLKRPDASPIRDALVQNPYIFTNLLNGKLLVSTAPNCCDWVDICAISSDGTLSSECEMLVLSMIDRCAREIPMWFADARELIQQMREVWKSADFKVRHVVRTPQMEIIGKREEKIHVQMLHLTKYKVPKLMVSCFLRYIRSNYEELELLFDVLTVFIGNFVTDFTFVRQFLEQEVIPIYPIDWRRRAFLRVMDMFDSNPEETTKDLGVVKVIQYLIAPCLQYALERYDVDIIVGPCAFDVSAQEMEQEELPEADRKEENLVARLAKVIEANRSAMSDRMMVVLYQLSTIFVQHAPQHIHDNSNKRQGARLRTFMLFAWPCLNHPTQDVTIKYSGHLFLSHIIEKFTINRKIVLQVYHSLMSAYTTDNRDVVKRAIDIITPAVPIRMDDGDHQLLTAVKKVLSEETHNGTHIYHCIYMICRNYRVYFTVRHEMLPSLLGALNRLTSHLGAHVDGRRLAIEVCEMIIKWDLLRNQKLEQQEDREQDDDVVETVLEKLKSGSGNYERDKREEERRRHKEGGSEPPQGSSQDSSGSASIRRDKESNSLKMPISKDNADYVINLLMKLATQLPHSQNQQQQQLTAELNKRSITLLRAALKPQVWGDSVSIKVHWIEKHLAIPTDAYRPDGTVSTQVQQAIQTLEVLVTLVQIMPTNLVVHTIFPLQRSIISCLTCGNNQLTRTVNSLVSRLCEKTRCSSSGLEDFDLLNQYMAKYLTEQLSVYDKNPAANIQNIYTPFSLLRILCLSEPAYLDTVMGSVFIRVISKAVKEHGQFVAQKTGDAKEKGMTELIAVALELVRPRIGAVSVDYRRALAQYILLPLIEKTDSDKMIDAVLKSVHELIVTHNEESNSSNVGLPLLVHMMGVMDRRYRKHNELMRAYLNSLLYVFERPYLRTTEYAEKMQESFYWGLCFADEILRNKFLLVWESNVEPSAIARLQFIFSQQDWSQMKDQFWIKHAIYLLLKCVKERATVGGRRVRADHSSATFWRTFKETSELHGSNSHIQNTVVTGVENMEVGEIPEGGDMPLKSPKREILESSENNTDADSFAPTGSLNVQVKEETETLTDHSRLDGDVVPETQESCSRSSLSLLLEEQYSLLKEANAYDMADSIDAFCGLIFNVTDWQFISSVFSRLFTSMWCVLSDREKASFEAILMPFLSSGIHLSQSSAPNSVVSVLIDTFNQCRPPIRFDPSLVKYLSGHHRSWHRGILILEEMTLRTSRMIQNPNMQYARTKDMPIEVQQNLEVLDALSDLYSELGEMDQFSVVWDRRAFNQRTTRAIELISKGESEDACNYLEATMQTHEEQLARMTPAEIHAQCTPQWNHEQELWFKLWTDCTIEMSRWPALRDFANSSSVQDACLLMRVAPHMPDWVMLRECKDQISGCIPPDFLPQFAIHSVMLAIMDPEPNEKPQVQAERALEESSRILIDHWKSLPNIVDQAHVRVLQAMNSIQEMTEASVVMGHLAQAQSVAQPGVPSNFNHAILHEMKSIVKTWRNRAGANSDSLSVVVSAQHWRLVMHAAVVAAFDVWERKGVRVDVNLIPPPPPPVIPSSNSSSLLPIHSSAQGQVAIAKMARQRRLYDLAEESLNRLHTMSLLPSVDAHGKILEQLKLYKAIAEDPRVDRQRVKEVLIEALDLCESTRLDEFSRDCLYKIYYQKGCALSKLNRNEDAERAFSTAAQLQDGVPPSLGTVTGAYKAWGRHLDELFHQNRTSIAASIHGISAAACYLEAVRHDNDQKASKNIARLLWTCKCVYEIGSAQAAETLDLTIARYAQSIVPANWLQWLPSLVTEIKVHANSGFIYILSKIGSAHPQQVFYAIRAQLPVEVVDAIVEEALTPAPVLFTLKEWQVKLVDLIKDLLKIRPCDIRALHRILSTVSSLKEFWIERQLIHAVDLIENVNRVISSSREVGVQTAICGPEVAKSARQWHEELTNPSREYITDYGTKSNLNQNDDREFQSSFSSTVCSFLSSIDCSTPALPQLQPLITFKTDLEKRLRKLPKAISLSSLSSYLFEFSNRTANVEMFCDLFSVRAVQYVAMMARFSTYVHINIRGGRVMKRIDIRAQTGKQLTYLIRQSVNSSNIGRVPQFMRHLNHMLQKEPETCRRFLRVHVPNQIQAADNCKLLEVSTADHSLVHPMEVMSDRLREIFVVPDEMVHFFFDAIQCEEGREADIPHMMFRQFTEYSGESWVSPWLLQRYISTRIIDPSHFFTIRKQIAQQLGVLCVTEMAFNLSPMRLEDMTLSLSSGQLCHVSSRFRIDSQPPPPVPFRFTPNLQRLIGISRDGHMRWSMIATAKCILMRKPNYMTRPLLWDELANSGFVNVERTEQLTRRIESTIQRMTAPDAEKLKEDAFSALLISQNDGNLSKMDPSWHPWF